MKDKSADEQKLVEERLRLQINALEFVANAIIITDCNGCIIWVNPAFTKLTGYRSEEALGKNPRLLKSDKHDELFYKNLWKTILSGDIWSNELVNRRKDGSLYMEEQTITPVRDTHGAISHFIAIKQDISARKHNEEKIRTRIRQQAAIAKLGQRALSDIDLPTLMNESVSLVAQTLEVEYCKVLEFIPERNIYLLWAGVSRKGEEEYTIVGAKTNLMDKYILPNKNPVIVGEIDKETYIKEPMLFCDPGVVSYINVVIHGQGEFLGVLGAYTTRERRFERDDISFLQAIANILAEGIERKRTERALQASEANFRGLLESAPDAIVIANREGNIVLVNAQTERMFGYKREELHGKPIEVLVPKSFWEGYIGYQTEYHSDPRIKSVTKMEKETFGRRKNGNEFPVDIRLSPMETKEGILIISTIRDIRERKKAEEEHIQLIREQAARAAAQQEIAERRQAEEEIRLLQTLTLAISESQDTHSALGVVLRKVCEATGWVLGQAWIPIPDATLLHCSPAWYSSVSGLEEFRILSEGFTFPPGIGLPGSAWSAKQTVWMRDVTESTNFPRLPIAKKIGLKAGLAIPVFVDNEVAAVIEFFMLELREGDERVERLVSAVATQLSSVIRRHRAEEDLRIKTGQLVAVTSAMTVLIESRNWQEAGAIILRCVLTQTESEYGFIGVLTKGPTLHVLSFEGINWDKVIGHEFYENALRTYHKVRYLEFTNLENLFGKVITSKKAVISNNPATDPRSKGLPPGHPPLRHFLGVPILREKEVVGMIGVANRQGGYGGTEQSKIEILSKAAAVLCDTYRRHKKR